MVAGFRVISDYGPSACHRLVQKRYIIPDERTFRNNSQSVIQAMGICRMSGNSSASVFSGIQDSDRIE